MNPRLERIYQEAALAACFYSTTRRVEVDPDGGRWVLIYDFPLPRGYNRATTHLLLLLPPNYPSSPPDWFYLDPGLCRADGRSLYHYFEDRIPPALRDNGWAGGCLHIREWRPTANPLQGHSLLTVCKVVFEALKRWASS